MQRSLTIPLPGEVFHTPRTIADDHDRTSQAVTEAIRENRIEAININGRWAIADAERQRLLREGWPSRNAAVSQFWQEWREFRRQRRQAMEAA